MKRLDPRAVAAMYLERGLKPGAGWWRGEDRNGKPDVLCACGIGVMLPEYVDTRKLSPSDAARELMLTEEYVLGFTDGFDYGSITLVGKLPDDFLHGFNDGLVSYQLSKAAVENEE